MDRSRKKDLEYQRALHFIDWMQTVSSWCKELFASNNKYLKGF